jgi:DNA/RNA-binding domain of Phe-tRNA-synthetase-like protein
VHIQHAPDIWREFPQLVAGVAVCRGVGADAGVADAVARFEGVGRSRLADAGSPAELPEVAAWRRAFSQMGLKPTQYRCASEALLRRLGKEGDLPRLHPLIDLCNAVSVAYAIPVAVFDSDRIAGHVEVRHARGDEEYRTFGGDTEHPHPGEVIFADAGDQVHARRWCNRQSGYSAVGAGTTTAVIVAEAMHASAATDVPDLIAAVGRELAAAWSVTPETALLSEPSPRFEF